MALHRVSGPNAHRSLRKNAGTIAKIRLLKSIGGVKKRGGRLPRQRQPDAIRLEYFKAIRPVCEEARAAFAPEAGEILRQLRHMRAAQGKHDAEGGPPRWGSREGEAAAALVDRAATRFSSAFRPKALFDVAKKFGKRTSDFQKEQLDRQVRAAIGVPFTAIEKPVREKMDEFAARNVDLIKTVPDRYFDRIRLDVQNAFTTGIHPQTLADQFVERYDMAENDAMRIARDQIGKLNAEVNQERQEALGVTGYIWRTMNDNRVRDEHEEREGESFDWDDPPEDGHPGEPVQCRCYSEPDFSPILDGVEGDDSSGGEEEGGADLEPDDVEGED